MNRKRRWKNVRSLRDGGGEEQQEEECGGDSGCAEMARERCASYRVSTVKPCAHYNVQ